MFANDREAVPFGNVAQIHEHFADFFLGFGLKVEGGFQFLLIDQPPFQENLSNEFFRLKRLDFNTQRLPSYD